MERYLKVLDAIDLATEEGDKATADKLTRLLNAGRANQALEQIKTGLKPGKGKPVKVDVPRTIHGHATMAFSEFYEACAKAGIEEETACAGAVPGQHAQGAANSQRPSRTPVARLAFPGPADLPCPSREILETYTGRLPLGGWPVLRGTIGTDCRFNSRILR